MMISLRKAALLTSLLCLGAVSAAAQGLNIATVNMQTLFKDYYLTAEAQEDINVKRAFIQKENAEKLVAIREIEENLQKLRKSLQDSTISDSKRAELTEEFRSLSEEGQALNRERTEYLQRRSQDLNTRMEQRMRGILEQIMTVVKRRAQEDAYDYVFDNSGLSTTQVPFVLYAKDATDITAALLKELNKDAPQDGAEAPAAE